MRKPAPGTPGAGFCLWYGLWSEYARNYVNKYYSKKVAVFSKNKAKNCNFLVRVAGFEPTASWSRTTVCYYIQSKCVQYLHICAILRTFMSNTSTPVYLEMGQFGTRKWVKS